MSIKFQYNKTSLQSLDKQLKIRVRALPTLKNKESALRIEVKRAKEEAEKIRREMQESMDAYQNMVALWSEFRTDLVKIEDVNLGIKKIAGVKTPILEGIEFSIKEFSVFNNPKWFLEGTSILKQIATLGIKAELFNTKMRLLDHARKKTTQKVNLFEKVQIPGYEDAIRKIKRFLEDEDNLSKSAQKIVKDKQQRLQMEESR